MSINKDAWLNYGIAIFEYYGIAIFEYHKTSKKEG
jgi:hypothetical protein